MQTETGYVLSNRQRLYLHIKQILDLLISLAGLFFLAVPMMILAVAIWIDDPGPVLFRQKRIGRDQKPFIMLKFRSMRMDTPHDTPTHLLSDPYRYITRVGRFLRKTSLDELPQLFNILMGQMSIVGPRPALWNQFDLIEEREKYGVHQVRPGLTGWAQVNGRDELEIPVKARLDGEYIEKFGLVMDIRCFFATFGILSGKGVVEGGTGAIQEPCSAKRVLFLTNHAFMFWQFRRELMAELLRQGFSVTIGVPFGDHVEDFEAMGCRMLNIPVDRRGINPVTDGKLLLRYWKLLRREKPDLVVTYSIKPNIYAGLVCRILGIPYCVNVQGLGTAFQKPGISQLVTFLYRIALKKARVVFFENSANAQLFREKKITPEKQQCLLRGAGINLDFYARLPYPRNDRIHFLYLGRLMKEKGIGELFAAVHRLRDEGEDFFLDLVGFHEEGYREQVEELEALGICKFHGFQQNPRPYYAAADCVVLPSYHEGMSNVLLEAAATSRPLITSDIPGCREAVDEGISGYTCASRDADSLYDAMKRFLSLSHDQREAMGKAGRKKMEAQFDKKQVVQATVNALFQEECI